MKEVKEGTTSYHPITIVDKNGGPVTPELLRYKITSDKGTIIKNWTIISNSTTEIEVTPTENTITGALKIRYLTVEATHNGGKKIVAEESYTIKDLVGI